MKKKINILISCVGGLFIYDVIESLRKSKDFDIKIYGIDIDAFAYNKSLLDFFSQCPDVSKKEKKYKNFLFKLIRKSKIDFFLHYSDNETTFLIKNKNIIKKKFPRLKFVFDIDNENNKVFSNKSSFYNFCNKHKINSFNYKLLKNIKDFKHKNKKFILKRSSSSGSEGVFLIDSKIKKPVKIIESRNVYKSNFNYFKKYSGKFDYIMMPYFIGQGYDVDCLSRNGKILKMLIRKRMMYNQFMHYSPGHKIMNESKIKKMISKIIKLLKITGLSTFDLIKTKNKYNVIDMALRPSGSVSIGNFAGCDFIMDLIKMNYKKKILKKTNWKNKIVQPFLMFKKCNNKYRIDKYVPYFLDQKKI